MDTFHASDRLADQLVASAFAISAIFFRIIRSIAVLVLFAVIEDALVVFTKSLKKIKIILEKVSYFFATVIVSAAFLHFTFVVQA